MRVPRTTIARSFSYFTAVLAKRIRINRCKESSSNESDVPLLPIPLIQSRIIEVLGAVTMVCFVDDGKSVSSHRRNDDWGKAWRLSMMNMCYNFNSMCRTV